MEHIPSLSLSGISIAHPLSISTGQALPNHFGNNSAVSSSTGSHIEQLAAAVHHHHHHHNNNANNQAGGQHAGSHHLTLNSLCGVQSNQHSATSLSVPSNSVPSSTALSQSVSHNSSPAHNYILHQASSSGSLSHHASHIPISVHQSSGPSAHTHSIITAGRNLSSLRPGDHIAQLPNNLSHSHISGESSSGTSSVTPSALSSANSSAMAAAAAAHLHHSAQSSPMTNLHQNMGTLMNSGGSAR